MKKLISVTCPELDSKHDYLTSGKIYEIIEIEDEDFGFWSISDIGVKLYSGFKNSSHIENKNWILNYETDTSEISKGIVAKLLLDAFHNTEGWGNR